MSANPSPKKKPARRHVRKSAKRSPKSPPKKRNRRRLDLKPGQPEAKSKLTYDLQQRICNVVAAGQSRERAASLNGINRSTIRNWLLKAQEDPKSRYADSQNVKRRAAKQGPASDGPARPKPAARITCAPEQSASDGSFQQPFCLWFEWKRSWPIGSHGWFADLERVALLSKELFR
jgi:transposase-like protein